MLAILTVKQEKWTPFSQRSKSVSVIRDYPQNHPKKHIPNLYCLDLVSIIHYNPLHSPAITRGRGCSAKLGRLQPGATRAAESVGWSVPEFGAFHNVPLVSDACERLIKRGAMGCHQNGEILPKLWGCCR